MPTSAGEKEFELMDAFGGVMLFIISFGFGAMMGIGIFGLIQNKRKTKTRVVYRYRDAPSSEQSDENAKSELNTGKESQDQFIPRSATPPVTPNIPKEVWTDRTTQLWYDMHTRNIVAEVDGEIIDMHKSMTQEQKARFSFLVLDLKKWIGENLLPGMEDDVEDLPREIDVNDEEDEVATPVIPVQQGHEEIEEGVTKDESVDLPKEEMSDSPEEEKDIITEIEDKIYAGFSKVWNYFIGEDEEEIIEETAPETSQEMKNLEVSQEKHSPNLEKEKEKEKPIQESKLEKLSAEGLGLLKNVQSSLSSKINEVKGEKQEEPGGVKPLSPFDPRNIMKGIAAAETDKIKLPPPPSIADQINEILQKELRGSDWPLGHFEVFDGEDHSINFRIGVNVYKSIDEIIDQNAKKVIQSAIDIWQQSLG